ncbi:ABC-ATPase domain-containing protein, partial [Fibrobacter sp.]
MKALYQKIRTLNGKNYGLYKSLADKPWDFGDFVLEFLHVQGDPYAPASRVVIKANLSMLGYAGEWGGSFERRLALSDFLHRKLSLLVQEKYPDKDAAVIFDVAGPEMLVRNSLWIDNGELRACLQVKLPGEGRKIQAELAAEILTMVLPDLVSAGLYYDRSDEGALQEHYRVLAERKEILSQLDACGLCAFVPNGAVLPRASGLSEMPLEKAIPFVAPEEMAVTLNVCGHEIRGMGIPKGISVITGGAFHGKSTLLQALTRSVYPHIPGDGREGIVIDETALRIGVEDGRSVRGTDLSMFVRDLPGGVSTKNFNTLSASGSTSEAANLLEAMEAGSRTFLIDEDSSAVNFLIRDVRVRKLLGDDREPLIPLTDRIKELAAAGFSFILVAGACGDYLDLADNIIVMANYKAECAKFTPAPSMSSWRGEAPTESTEPAEVTHPRSFVTYMQPL